MPPPKRTNPKPKAALREPLGVCRWLNFEPHDIAAQLDARGRYTVPLDEEFPFAIKPFHFTSRRHTRGGT